MKNKNQTKIKKRRINKKIISLSVIAIICLVLTFTINWLFIIPAVIISIMNQRELFSKK
jgi:uncharacterized membrane protein